ncbi:MAG: cytochrome D ubiquinol oxidase subunit II, partial [Phormidium sp.]
CQTGRYGPVPLILIDRPGGDYWTDWDRYVEKHLVNRGLVNPEDRSVYTITDDLDVACEAITSFYRVYHSSRYVGEQFVVRLKSELKDSDVEWLNENFSDILVKGRIEKTAAFPQETGDETFDLPRLAMYFNQRDLGRLYQMIAAINRMNLSSPESEHPERK